MSTYKLVESDPDNDYLLDNTKMNGGFVSAANNYNDSNNQQFSVNIHTRRRTKTQNIAIEQNKSGEILSRENLDDTLLLTPEYVLAQMKTQLRFDSIRPSVDDFVQVFNKHTFQSVKTDGLAT